MKSPRKRLPSLSHIMVGAGKPFPSQVNVSEVPSLYAGVFGELVEMDTVGTPEIGT